ncbi:MAG: NAD(P)H-dependent oxidoreductase [Pseudomonadota bacterium]
MTLKLLGISGSLRKDSTNTKLLHEAIRLFGAAEVEIGDLRLPLYDGDLEAAEGIPAGVATLADQMRAADAIVFCTPEYNKNLPGVLKNALDWVSRTKPMPMGATPVAILSAAAGRAGGERSQYSLRHCLTPFSPRVIQGPEVMIAASGDAFDEGGRLKDERASGLVEKLMAALRAEAARG